METSLKSRSLFQVLIGTILLLIFVSCANADASSATTAIDSLIGKTDDQNLKDHLEKVKTLLNEPTSGENSKKVIGIVNAVGKALPKLNSGDGLQIAIGALEILKPIAEAFPGAGPTVGAIIGLVSSVLGLFSSTKVSRSTDDIVREALNDVSDNELEGEIEGAKLALSTAMDYLKPKINENLTKSEADGLASKIHITLALRPIGMVKTRIERRKASNVAEEGRRAIKFVALFCQLFTMRDLVYRQMISIVKSSGHDGEAKSFTSARDGQLPTYKETLKFLTEPDESTATAISFYYPPGKDRQSKYIQSCLKFLSLSPDSPSMEFIHFERGTALSNLKWPKYYNSIKIDNPYQGYLEVDSPGKSRIYAMRHFFHAEDDKYYVIRMGNKDLKFLTTDGTWLYTTEKKEGDKSEFLIMKVGSNIIMISPKEYPGKFFQVQGHYVGLVEGNPGKEGHFKPEAFSKRNKRSFMQHTRGKMVN